MVVEFLTPVAGWALGKAADTVWTLATDQVQTKLQRTDIERAIKAGLTAVQAWERSLEVEELLFKRCDDKQKRQFLEQVFTDAGVVEQLQRPLAGKGEPDVALLQKYFEQVAKDTGIELTQSSLPQWLSIFAQTYFAKTALFIKYELARQRYLEQLANWYDDVKFLGISVAGQEDTKSEKLRQIFVMPDVKKRHGSQKVSLLRDALDNYYHLYDIAKSIEVIPSDLEKEKHDKTKLDLKTSYNPTLLSDTELKAALELYTSRSNRFPKRALLLQEQRRMVEILGQAGETHPANQVLQRPKSSRCVLLGAPGSGKTTLMSYFAVALATGEEVNGLGVDDSYLPIVVRIRDWVQSDQTGLLDYIRAFATDKLAVKDLPEGFFEHWLEAGKALILLDGLDEVANEARRDDVVNQIEVFLQGQPYRENPAIITSRPAGYKQAYFRTEEFPHYDLLPFDQPKIDTFIQNWYDNRFQNREESQRRQQTLKKALSERDRIQVLARNPLLLTIIALIHRYEAYLPRDRHQLYNRAVETLLTNWDAGKDIDYTWPLQHLKRDAVRRVMEQLAYWIHSEGSVGDDEGGTLIDREELIEQLSGFIKEEANCKRYEAEADAERFLAFIRSRTGLLNEQGQDRYAFVHKTFQEYLAAEDIKYRAYEEYDEEIILQPIREHLHDPHWEEVLLLLIAQQPKKRVAQIMQQILEHDTLYEQWLHRNLFFAADCLAENVKLADTPLIEQILSRLVEFIASDSPLISSQLQQRAEKCLMNLGETAFQEVALRQVEVRENQFSPVKFQQCRFALGQEVTAIEALIGLSSNDNSTVRYLAVGVLGQIGEATPKVIKALIDRFSDDESKVLHRAEDALGKLARTSCEVIQALIECLDDDEWKIHAAAALSLEEPLEADHEVIQALIECLDDDEWKVRKAAAASLGKLGQATPEIVQALTERLSDPDYSVCIAAASSLGKLGCTAHNTLQTLINNLSHDELIVRSHAASNLGKIGQATSEVVEALRKCLREHLSNVELHVSSDAATALRELGQISPGDVQDLIFFLDDEDQNVRSQAACALGKLGYTYPDAVPALIKSLEDSHSYARIQAISSLASLKVTNSDVLDALVSHLVDEDDHVRSIAAEALRELGQATPEVVEALADRLSDKATIVRYSATYALGQLGRATPEILKELINSLNDPDDTVRFHVAFALSELAKQTQTAITQLAEWTEQNKQSEYVSNGIDALWKIVVEQA